MHYPFAKTIQNFYRKHRKESYNHTLESALKGLDPSMETVMRAMLRRMDSLEKKVADVSDKVGDNKGDEEAKVPYAGRSE